MQVVVSGSPVAGANGTWTITVLTPTTYSLNGSTGTSSGSGGQWTLPGGGVALLGSTGNGAYVSGGAIVVPVFSGNVTGSELLTGP
jgi:hypothetical protein